MGLPRQEYLNALPFPSPGDLPNPRIEPISPAWQADSLPMSHLGSTQSSRVLGNKLKCQSDQVTTSLKEEHWNGLSFPSSGDLPDPGIKLAFPPLAGRLFMPKLPEKPLLCHYSHFDTYNLTPLMKWSFEQHTLKTKTKPPIYQHLSTDYSDFNISFNFQLSFDR